MVYLSEQAENDLYQILVGLATWEKHPLEFAHAASYVEDIRQIALSLDQKSHHFNCKFPQHKLYGAKFTRYRRNKSTVWYIIYNISPKADIFIEKILSNYEMVEG